MKAKYKVELETGIRVCPGCREPKLLNENEFFRCKNRASGFTSRCKACMLAYHETYIKKLKSELIAAYGGCCSCCGESEPRFLTLEHLERDGQQHRRSARCSGSGTWRDLKRRGWLKDKYTVYCWNCNEATRLGVPCPHAIARKFKALQ